MSAIQMLMGGVGQFAFARNPASVNEVAAEALTLTVGSDGSVTCGGYSDRWWLTGATPPTCYATYDLTEQSAGNPAFGTTMDLTPTRSATSSSPAIVCDQGVLRGSVSIYDASSGGNLLCSFSFDMESSY